MEISQNTSTALKLAQKIVRPLHSNEIHSNDGNEIHGNEIRSKVVTINVKTTVCIDICLAISPNIHNGKELTSFKNL